MKSRVVLLSVIALALVSMMMLAQGKGKTHLNTMVDLLLQHKPVFGIYAPTIYNLPGATPPQRGPRGGATSGPPPPLQPITPTASSAAAAAGNRVFHALS